MLLYKTTFTDPTITEETLPTPTVSWQGSQTESSKARSTLKALGLKPTTQTVEVPTNKAGLLEWLNANVSS